MNNLRVAIRTLLKRPGYGLSVLLTLALGIGASAMMFTLLDAAVLRPLPFSQPNRLVMLWGVAGVDRVIRGGSFPEVSDWRSMNGTLADVSLYDEISLNMRIGDEPLRLDAEMVSAGFFPLLGANAALGRTFLPEEDRTPDAAPVAIISHKLWMERFGGDRTVVGRSVVLNDRSLTIVGVMPDGFAGLSFDTDIWIPSMMVSLTSAPSVVQARGTRWLGALGRLKDGISVERAQEDLTRVATLLEKDHPDFNRQRGVQVMLLHESMLGTTGPLMVSLFAAVLLFLVVACGNVAGLQLARTTARRRELAVRVALGARNWHLLKQLLTESLVLAALSGIIGALLAAWGVAAAIVLIPAGALPRHATPSVDPRALAFVILASMAAAVLIAVLPVLASRRRELTDVMKEGARSAAPGLGTLRRISAPQALVAGEIALAMTLLTGAGLMARSLDRQLNVRVGFDAAGVTVARVTLPGGRYPPDQRTAFVERLEERLKAIPLVRAAAVSSDLPFTGNSSASVLVADAAPDAPVRYYRHQVTPDFLRTLSIPLLAGRTFTPQDRQSAPLVAIISESGAKRLWPGQDAVGRHLGLGAPNSPSVEIVGVVATARFRSLTADLTAAKAEPDVYFPFAQRTDRDLEIAVRSTDGGTIPMPLLQQAVSGLDPGLPVYSVQRLEDAAAQQTATARLASVLLGVFSTGSLLLSAVALYGLVSYVVGLSRREIAIRIALGADARRVVALIVRNGMVLVAVGLAAGSVGAMLAARAVETQLFETPKADPLIFGGVATMLLLVSLVASFVPARRAVRVDPQIALRAE